MEAVYLAFVIVGEEHEGNLPDVCEGVYTTLEKAKARVEAVLREECGEPDQPEDLPIRGASWVGNEVRDDQTGDLWGYVTKEEIK